MRARIDASLGPVWEANHVWLIFIVVYLWGGFPRALAAITTTLAVAFALVGLGAVFRGGAFVFRKSSTTLAGARLHGIVFAVSSLLISSSAPSPGRWQGAASPSVATTPCGPGPARSPCRVASSRSSPVHSWPPPSWPPTPNGSGEVALAAAFRRRALGTGVVTGSTALLAAATIGSAAPALADGLRGRAGPLVVSAIAGLSVVIDLRAGRFEPARSAAFAAVGAIVAGVAQYPAILVGSAEIKDVAGPRDLQPRPLHPTVAGREHPGPCSPPESRPTPNRAPATTSLSNGATPEASKPPCLGCNADSPVLTGFGHGR